MDPKLTIELVPSTCWYSNLRSELPKEKWDVLRRACYKWADYKCQVCGDTGPKHPVECHEVWDYDDNNKVQKLEGVIALCPNCHMVKHMGRSQVIGKGEHAKNHLKKVNGWSNSQAVKYINKAFNTWERRSQFEWELDLSWLEGL